MKERKEQGKCRWKKGWGRILDQFLGIYHKIQTIVMFEKYLKIIVKYYKYTNYFCLKVCLVMIFFYISYIFLKSIWSRFFRPETLLF